MSVECQVNVKSQSELGIGGCETCSLFGLDTRVSFDLSLLVIGVGVAQSSPE